MPVVFHLDKLIRDKLPEEMRSRGQKPQVKVLTGAAHVRALIAKVAEELSELNPDDPSYKAELADLLQVINDLVALAGADEVEAIRADAEQRKGGFVTGSYVTTLTLQDDDEWVEYYRKEPERFPEEKGGSL